MVEGSASAHDFLQRRAEALQGLLTDLDLVAVERVARVLERACREGRTVYCLGNGGSAATASHLATDLTWGRRGPDEPRLKAVSLVANQALLTALANDVGYAEVFVEQLKAPFGTGDVLVAISASGKSENVVKAVRYANEHGGVSAGLVGFDGGTLKELCQVCVHVPTPVGAYELVEDVHHAVCHMIATLLRHSAGRRSSVSGDGPR